MVGIPSAVNAVQEITAELSPAPVTFHRISSAKALKNRLDWGKPDLTIIDVRDRDSFNQEHITGAIWVPLDDLVTQIRQWLEFNRDIYLYSHADSDMINAAAQLDRAGFERVAILDAGLSGWKAVHGPTEGRQA
jgi:rhodanese-related sulfurtransferase